MKNKTVRFLIIIASLFLNRITYGQPPPPGFPPGEGPPPPLGFPIDENVTLVAILAFFFGIQIIYKHTLKQKEAVSIPI